MPYVGGFTLLNVMGYPFFLNLRKMINIMEINNYKHNFDISDKPKSQNLSQSLNKADFCDKNIHWYAGVYRNGRWIYNECSICKKRQQE